MNATGRAMPGWAWTEGCECREVFIDWVARTIYHPSLGCPYHGQTTQLDIEDEAPL